MSDVKRKFRLMYEQAFIPIFVKDDLDTDLLIEGCKRAGVRFIEYTLRREDAKEVIPTLKQRYPDCFFTVGSTLDSDRVIRKLTAKYPQLMTFEEIAQSGADGFVSMLPMSSETIRKYCHDFLMIPGAETTGEALRQVDAGAHFIKIMGGYLPLVKRVNSAPASQFCPVFVTGGVTPATMQEVFGSGSVLVASGFDVLLQGIDSADLHPDVVAQRISEFQSAAVKTRAAIYPELENLASASDDEFFTLLPNYSPF